MQKACQMLKDIPYLWYSRKDAIFALKLMPKGIVLKS
jgi:hypothetical protein